MSSALADAVEAAIGALPAAGLADTVDAAALQDRVDRKYVVGTATAAQLLELIAGPAGASLVALEIAGARSFGYRSVYFDTDARHAFLAAAHGRPQRAKVRTRHYLESAQCMLEVKVRDRRGRTIKHRTPHAVADQHRVTAAGAHFVRERLAGSTLAPFSHAALLPSLTTAYRRSTLWSPHGALRLTLDVELRCTDLGGGSIALDDALVVEVKSPGPVTVADRWLWRLGARPVAFSKYGVGLAALDRTLPANRWHRVLAEHFGDPVAQRDRRPVPAAGRGAPSRGNHSEFQGWIG